MKPEELFNPDIVLGQLAESISWNDDQTIFHVEIKNAPFTITYMILPEPDLLVYTGSILITDKEVSPVGVPLFAGVAAARLLPIWKALRARAEQDRQRRRATVIDNARLLVTSLKIEEEFDPDATIPMPE